MSSEQAAGSCCTVVLGRPTGNDEQAGRAGFRAMRFNAVVQTNFPGLVMTVRR